MLSQALSQISDLLHGEFEDFWYSDINKIRDDSWLKLFAARDLMRDTIDALHYDINKCSGTVLGVYGFMQALYLQQDALKIIYQCIKGEALDLKDYDDIKEVRRVRNDVIGGHPLFQGKNSGDNRYNVLAPHLINGWEITICDHAKGFEPGAVSRYDLLELRDKQTKEIEEILINLINFITLKLKTHKEKFMSDKLNDLFKGVSLSRIMQEISSPSVDSRVMAESECKFLKEQLKKLLKKLSERSEGSIELEEKINRIIWGLENILKYCVDSKDDLIHAYLLWKGLNSLFKEMKEILIEIDSRYEVDENN